MATTQTDTTAHAPANPDPFATLSGTFTKPGGLTARLQWASDNAHIISPATTCGKLPEGCSVALTIVYLDMRDDAHSVGGGKYGLLKHAVMKLAVAAGVAFDPHSSGRQDDGSDPYYCNWRAIGAWRHLDGSVLTLVGDKEMDLREGSAQVERIYANASGGEAAGDKQLMEMRAFIVGHAQTKAELRAIRKGLGIRSYTASEFEKPWVVAKLMFTGQSDNPRIAEANAAAIRNSMLGGSQALFGPPPGSTVPAPQLPVVHYETSAIRHAPPPVALSRGDDDSSPRLNARRDTPAPSQAAQPAIQSDAKAAAPKSTRARGGRGSSGATPFVAKFGRMKDKPIVEWDEENLNWYTSAFKASMEDASKANFRESNEAGWKACLAERERREGVPPETGSAQPQANGAQQSPQTPPPPSKPAAPNFDEADRGDDADQY